MLRAGRAQSTASANDDRSLQPPRASSTATRLKASEGLKVQQVRVRNRLHGVPRRSPPQKVGQAIGAGSPTTLVQLTCHIAPGTQRPDLQSGEGGGLWTPGLCELEESSASGWRRLTRFRDLLKLTNKRPGSPPPPHTVLGWQRTGAGRETRAASPALHSPSARPFTSSSLAERRVDKAHRGRTHPGPSRSS